MKEKYELFFVFKMLWCEGQENIKFYNKHLIRSHEFN